MCEEYEVKVDYPCERCGGGDYEIFMVNHKLWNSSGLTGQICIKCVESVLGRKLVREDFILDAPCNLYIFRDRGWELF
jgi:hypothetical protein